LKTKCSEKYLGPRKMNQVRNLEYYITRSIVIYTGHLVVSGERNREGKGIWVEWVRQGVHEEFSCGKSWENVRLENQKGYERITLISMYGGRPNL
jgi:hypothetical protein